MRGSSCAHEVDVSVELPGSEVRCACGRMLRVPGASPAEARPAFPSPEALGAAKGGPAGSPFRLRARTEEEPAPARPPGGPCPRCVAPMRDVAGAPGEAWACASCGVFVAHGTIEALVAKGAPGLDVELAAKGPRRRAPGAEEVRYLPCPRCASFMDRRVFGGRSGVVVDVCPAHGTFFDNLELERALAHARANPGAPGEPGAPRGAAAETEIALSRISLGAVPARRRQRHGLLDAVLALLGGG